MGGFISEENIANLTKRLQKFDGKTPGKPHEWSQKDRCCSDRLSARHLRSDGVKTTTDSCLLPPCVPPYSSSTGGRGEAAMASLVETVAAANEAVTASATFAAASEETFLIWNRASHDLYVALFLLTTRGAALLVGKHTSAESSARGIG